MKRLLIAYFIRNISVKKYQNPLMCIKPKVGRFLRHSVFCLKFTDTAFIIKCDLLHKMKCESDKQLDIGL